MLINKRKQTLNFINKIKIKFSNFNFAEITILIGILLIVFSMLSPWFSIISQKVNEGIFSNIFGITGIITIILIGINLFILFSKNTKKKIKLFFNNSFSDKNIFFISSIIFIILALNNYIIIKNGVNLFTNNIKIHAGITFYIIAIILYSSGTFFKLKQKNNKIEVVSINESEKTENFSNQNTNTIKLPFE